MQRSALARSVDFAQFNTDRLEFERRGLGLVLSRPRKDRKQEIQTAKQEAEHRHSRGYEPVPSIASKCFVLSEPRH